MTFTFTAGDQTITIEEKNEKRALKKALKDMDFKGAYSKEQAKEKKKNSTPNVAPIQDKPVFDPNKSLVSAIETDEQKRNRAHKVLLKMKKEGLSRAVVEQQLKLVGLTSSEFGKSVVLVNYTDDSTVCRCTINWKIKYKEYGKIEVFIAQKFADPKIEKMRIRKTFPDAEFLCSWVDSLTAQQSEDKSFFSSASVFEKVNEAQAIMTSYTWLVGYKEEYKVTRKGVRSGFEYCIIHKESGDIVWERFVSDEKRSGGCDVDYNSRNGMEGYRYQD